MSNFEIGWLFPDTMFLHGDRGNVLALAKYAELLGFSNSVTKIDFETKDFDPYDYDVLFMAPGEISSIPDIAEWMEPYRDKLASFVEEGHPLVVTGTSIGLFCENVVRADGEVIKGLGIIKSDMREREMVYGDDVLFKCEYNGVKMEIVGSQISMADIVIGCEIPFGELEYGYGNTGKDKNEGIIKENSIFTNALGPVLVTDPWLTVEIIRAAAGKNGKEPGELNYDFELERKSFDLKKKYNLEKETKLTNV